MSILTTDLVAYAAASNPVTDSGVTGGAIDLLRYVDFTAVTADDDIEVISSSASDTQNCTIVARDAAGNVTSQTAALTGTTAKIFNTLGVAGVINRVLSVELASVAIGTITVRRSVAGATVRTIPIGGRGFLSIFQQGASNPSTTVTYYAKFFWKNQHATLALTSAQVLENADPSTLIAHGTEGALNDTNTTTTRITAPGGITFASTAANVANAQSLTAGSQQGVWVRLSLGVGQAAQDPRVNGTYTSQITGNST